jgi:ABC-type multidrug transport system fused ATPase/permease subunit
VLFGGTLRYNLDPFDHYSDEQCMMALEAVQLKQMVLNHPASLLLPVAVSGTNLSAGECQLICVARAILKQSKILLIDEATANVDLEADALLQAVISNIFEDRTVLTIAHRTNTVAESDRILVLDKGMIADFDVPENILHQYE